MSAHNVPIHAAITSRDVPEVKSLQVRSSTRSKRPELAGIRHRASSIGAWTRMRAAKPQPAATELETYVGMSSLGGLRLTTASPREIGGSIWSMRSVSQD